MTKKKRERKERRRVAEGKRVSRGGVRYWVPAHGDSFAAWKSSPDPDEDAMLFAYTTERKAAEGFAWLLEGRSSMNMIALPSEEVFDRGEFPEGGKAMECAGLTGEQFTSLMMKLGPVMVYVDAGFKDQESFALRVDKESEEATITSYPLSLTPGAPGWGY
jgi:hypothetical protein